MQHTIIQVSSKKIISIKKKWFRLIQVPTQLQKNEPSINQKSLRHQKSNQVAHFMVNNSTQLLKSETPSKNLQTTPANQ